LAVTASSAGLSLAGKERGSPTAGTYAGHPGPNTPGSRDRMAVFTVMA